jgi:light-regulated signal transduction histidine kinase (bacteriophytochrome)
MTPQTATHPSQDPEQKLVRLVSDASHEIVGPVNQVSSLVSLFVNRYRGHLDDEAENLLAFISSAGVRVSEAANALRTYFQVLSSRPHLTRVDSHQALTAAIRTLQPEIDECGAEVTCDTLPDIRGDDRLLSILFETTIQNSLKFRRPDTPPRVAISAGHSLSGCLFSVSDNGIGIDPILADSVFTAFTKLNGHSYPGAGIGLTVARAAVELMEGRIWIVSPGEVGTTVFFELPTLL